MRDTKLHSIPVRISQQQSTKSIAWHNDSKMNGVFSNQNNHRQISQSCAQQNLLNCSVQASRGVWNARSLDNKTVSLCDYVIDKDLDIVSETDSWLHGEDRDNPVIADISNSFPNYNFFHVPCIGRQIGGVFVLAWSGFAVKQKDDFQTFKIFEVMHLNICSGSSSARIFTRYHPPCSAEKSCHTKRVL